MAEDSQILFTPTRIAGMALPNRIAMAPMTREFASGGVPGDDVVEYYRRRAAGGVGLIVTEGMAVNAAGAHDGPVPLLYREEARDALRRIAEVVHAHDARIAVQLWHVGLQDSPTTVNPDTVKQRPPRVGPSGIYGNGEAGGGVLDEKGIAATIEAFASAAEAAQKAGSDGIEIHAAHGYLPDQFLWSRTNRRDDRYGGGIAERTRFLVELLRACRAATAPDFPLILRYSQWKTSDYGARLAEDPRELAELLEPLAAAGVDAFHCSTRRFWEPAFAGEDRSLAGWTKLLTGKPVIAVGSVTLETDFKSGTDERGGGIAESQPRSADVARVAQAIAAGDFDVIAIGRALIANPDWADLVRTGALDRLRPFERAMLSELI